MEKGRKEFAEIKSLARKKAAMITTILILILVLFLVISPTYISWLLSTFVILLFGFLAFIGFYAICFNEETQNYYIAAENELISRDGFTPVIPLKNSIFFRDFLTRVKFYAQRNKFDDIYIFIIYNNEDTPILFDVLCSGSFFSQYKIVDQNN